MNWVALKSLNELYRNKETKIKETLIKDSLFQHLLNDTQEIKEGYKVYYSDDEDFFEMYEEEYLEKFNQYYAFLENNQLLKPQTRFEEADIIELMDMKRRMDSGELLPIRNQIIQNEETVRNVSSMFFKNEKYLIGKKALIDAVKQMLQIDELADDRDQQYMYRLECEDPKLIILCENLDFLKRPSLPRKYGYELWYAGGKNIEKLKYSYDRNLPIYYSGDWDYDGLLIFNMVCKLIPQIKLLYPTASSKSILKSEHKSLWIDRDNPSKYSNLSVKNLDNRHKDILVNLIEKNHWITEEDNHLKEMITLIQD